MKRIILTFIIFCHATLMIAQVQTARKTSGGRGYLEYLPDSYSSSSNFPCIIFLHGSGERGDGSPAALEKLKAQGIPKFIANGSNMCFTVNGQTECFVVLSPQQTTARWGWQGDVIPFIQYALANYKIDPERIYITGLSMGGYGTWNWSATEPHRFAAIAPVCGGGKPQDALKLKNLPVWTFHGARDNIVPLSESEDMVAALQACGGNVKFTVYPEAEHDSWTQTYNNPELYKWFLQHQRQ